MLAIKISNLFTDAFLNRSKEQFMSYFDIDMLNKYYLAKAFDNYTLFPFTKCDCRILHESGELLELLFCFDYVNGSHEEVVFQCCIQTSNEDKPIIIGLKIINTFCMLKTNGADFPIKNFDGEIKRINDNMGMGTTFLTEYELLVQKQSETKENIKPGYCQRLLSKSIRYRMSGPDIESAIILSNIVSKKLIWFSQNTVGKDSLETLNNINYGFKKLFRHKTYNEFKDENKDYFPVKELSFENVSANFDVFTYEYNQTFNPVEIRCSEIAHMYSALFTLSGLGKKQFVLILPFHYMNYLELGDAYYLIDVNHIVEMKSDRIYGVYDEINGCATAIHYFHQDGYSNMPEEELSSVINTITENLKNFKFKHDFKQRNILYDRYDFRTDPGKSYEENAFDNLQKLYDGAKSIPDSPFTSAKYIGQFIVVGYPQSYIKFGMNHEEVIKFSQFITSEDNLINWVKVNVKEDTLFSHSVQIMTSDQVIAHRIGRVYDKAVLIYTLKKLKGWINNGLIVFTDKNAYIMEDRGKYFDVSTMKYEKACEGELIIAFNEDKHYSLWHQKEKLENIKSIDNTEENDL